MIKNIVKTEDIGQYKGRGFVFGIQTTYRTYFVQCSDEENLLSWMTAVNGCIIKKPDPVQEKNVEKEHQNNMNDNKKISVDDFRKIKVIGKGGFGRVLLVEKKDSKKVYAMKILKKGVIAARGEIEHTRTEKSVLSKLDHPFLAKLHWSFQTDENLYFVMDFINGGELFHHLSIEKRFSDERAKFYAAEIVSCMEYLHSMGLFTEISNPKISY